MHVAASHLLVTFLKAVNDWDDEPGLALLIVPVLQIEPYYDVKDLY